MLGQWAGPSVLAPPLSSFLVPLVKLCLRPSSQYPPQTPHKLTSREKDVYQEVQSCHHVEELPFLRDARPPV